ncbi:MAG: hypothetical protein JXX14_01950 [Deltaproteobacteria bacterium]|nr:hypothetical protein [Deltaproteobacteria bacterium]
MIKKLTLYASLYMLWIPLISGCEESILKVEMLAYDPVSDQMVYKINTVETLDDVPTLSGRATRIRGGISIDISGDKVTVNRAGTPVAFNSVKIKGVHYPADYDSLAMISIYYNIEQAMLFFENLGMDTTTMGKLDTWYWADVNIIAPTNSETDEAILNNALFLAVNGDNRGFYVMPFDTTRIDGPDVPLSMNPGVLTHEYAHAVFQYLVLDRLPAHIQYPSVDSPFYINANYRMALNEGIADVFAVARTGDPDFMVTSIKSTMIARNAESEIVYTDWMDRNAAGYTYYPFDPYQIGAFISSIVYEIARQIAGIPDGNDDVPADAIRFRIAKWTYDSLQRLGEENLPDFVPAHFFSQFVAQMSKEQQLVACAVLAERFMPHYSEVEGCQ